MANELILIVEDNDKNRKLVRDVLQFKGYRLAEAETGEEGVRLAHELHPDLILMDIQLPGIDGATALRQLGGDPATRMIPALAVTASARGQTSRSWDIGSRIPFSQACVEAIDYPARRELDKALIRQLATCRWVAEHHAILISGMTGTGKSFIACALAHQACRKGYRALYRRASRLFHELTLAHADGTYIRLLGKLARVDVLLIDDFALAPLQDQERRDLLEILEDRYGTRATTYMLCGICRSDLRPPPAQHPSDRAERSLPTEGTQPP